MIEAGRECLKVLVVDDFDDSRYIFRRLMESKGCEVVEAADGEDAVEVARRECPGLILMDLNMPVLDGLAAAHRIRRLKEECSDAVIIAITAFDTYGMRDAAIEAGCDEYFTKPLEIEDLYATLRKLLPLWF